MNTRCYEDDEPNWTPRISAIADFKNADFDYKMSILRCCDAKKQICKREYYDYKAETGIGHFIHTYKQNANPLVSFDGPPVAIKIDNDIDAFATGIWQSLNKENKISLYVRYIDLNNFCYEERVFNKYER